MTKKEIEEIWPDGKIEFVCDYACEKLRNLLGINFVYLRNKGGEPGGSGDTWGISLVFENRLDGSFKLLDIHQDLVVKEVLGQDHACGADRMKDIRDKVILRIAGELKKSWRGE